MKATWLLALYPHGWRQRYGAEIAELLAQEPLTPHLVGDLIRGALDARLHPELAGPVLAAAGGGTVHVPSRGPRIGLYVVVVVFLTFFVFGGLYAYRAQTPAIQSIPVTQATSEVQAGRVSAVEISGSRATITLADGAHQQATLATAPDEPLSAAVSDYNRTHPANKVQLSYTSDQSQISMLVPALFSFLITFLPLALLALLVLLLARRLSQGSAGVDVSARYEWLARLADLRDRGVLTEDEFEREKRRLLD